MMIRFFVFFRENVVVLKQQVYKHKAKAPQRYKNVSLGSLAHA